MNEFQKQVASNIYRVPNEILRMILTMRFGLDGEKPMTLHAVAYATGKTLEEVKELQDAGLFYVRLRYL